MANNKVELSTGEVLIDLTSDTVTASNLLAGETAHNRSGEPITGTVNLNNYVLKSGDTMTGTLNLSNANISITGGNLKVNDTSNNINRVEKANFINAWYSSTGNKTYWGKMTEAGISFGQTTGDIRSSEVTAFTSPKSQLTSTSLKVNTHDLLKLTPHLAQMFATEIPENANLNTTTYLKVGQYFCPTGARAATLINYPASVLNDAFTMTVEAPIQTAYDNETSAAWVYRIRKITTGSGRQYLQMCSVSGTAGIWDYGVWKLVPSSVGYASTDLNSIMDSGLHVNGSSNLNAPTTWSGLITCGGAYPSWGAHQLTFSNAGMWFRSYTGNPLAWTNWIKVSTDDVTSVENLSSQVTNKASYVESVKVLKHGRTYMLNMRVSGSVPTSGWLTACNIPTSCTSSNEAVAASVAFGNAGNVNKGMSVLVGSGSVQIRMTTAMDATSNYAIITATWIY